MERSTPQQAETVQLGLFATALRIIGPKRRDYSGDADPYRNLRSAEILGVEPWRGALVRLLDKVSRIARLAERGGTGEVSSESLIDTAADLLNYTAIAVGLVIETMPDAQRRELLSRLAEAARTIRHSNGKERRHSEQTHDALTAPAAQG